MKDYIHKDYVQRLALNRLNTFTQVRAYQQEWFEEHNSRRGGWSGVGRVALATEEGTLTEELVGRKAPEDVTEELFPGWQATVSVQRRILRGAAAAKCMHAAHMCLFCNTWVLRARPDGR